jgi:hypothetical protein
MINQDEIKNVLQTYIENSDHPIKIGELLIPASTIMGTFPQKVDKWLIYNLLCELEKEGKIKNKNPLPTNNIIMNMKASEWIKVES